MGISVHCRQRDIGYEKEKGTDRKGRKLRLLRAGISFGLIMALTGCSLGKGRDEPAAVGTREAASEAETMKPTDPIGETIEPFPDWETQSALEVIPGTKILIATDIHYLARELTDMGDVFVDMIQHGDGKVTNYIWQIMEAFVQEVIREKPELLILSGDLSLNGELLSHQEFAGYLQEIESHGIPVAVIPGNHDINNVGASRYKEGRRIPAEITTPEQFRQIYGEFGYNEALSSDPESLSYVYPVNEDIWALMLDSCQYKEENLIGGMIDLETYGWIEEQLDAANEADVMLLPVSHHNLLDESRIYEDDCTIEHSERLIEMLENWDATLYLSGHLHVQHYMNSDREFDGTAGVYEIVTSSLATPPCQYGVLYFQPDGAFDYHTQILDVDSWAKASGQTDINLLEFSQYRVPFLENVFYNQAHDQLEKMADRGFSDVQMGRMSQVYARANCYYYWGRAVEIAGPLRESEEYELWSDYGADSPQAEYLEYILDEAVTDYNHLKGK